MHISQLDYNLDPKFIAQFPSDKRDMAKLLVYHRKSGEISHHIFRELPDLLDTNYHMFRNKVAVLKARIMAQRENGCKCECLILNPAKELGHWYCLLKPAKRMKIGSHFSVAGSFTAQIVEKFEDGRALVRFDTENGQSVVDVSEKIGYVPLPPYIHRNINSPEYDRNFDNNRYETVYADIHKRMAVAAPTAGLHFTKELNETLQKRGNSFCDVVLRVGIGTFKPLTSDIVEEHKMHTELYEIPQSSIDVLRDKSVKKLAIGTTSLRAIEDFCRKNPQCENGYVGEASLFVYPPQKIVSCDALITNFHLPRSTLMCLVGAFLTPGESSGIEILKEIYAKAMENDYRFFSYGDAMLIQ